MKMSRKEFLAALAGVAVVGVMTPSCGPDERGPGDGGTEGDGGTQTDGGDQNCAQPAIAGNHGHRMTVARADVEAGVEKTYDIQGTSAHPHTVTLTAAHFTTLAAGDSVTVQSSSDQSHSHSVTVSCP